MYDNHWDLLVKKIHHNCMTIYNVFISTDPVYSKKKKIYIYIYVCVCVRERERLFDSSFCVIIITCGGNRS